jgi:hypothetical protein
MDGASPHVLTGRDQARGRPKDVGSWPPHVVECTLRIEGERHECCILINTPSGSLFETPGRALGVRQGYLSLLTLSYRKGSIGAVTMDVVRVDKVRRMNLGTHSFLHQGLVAAPTAPYRTHTISEEQFFLVCIYAYRAGVCFDTN